MNETNPQSSFSSGLASSRMLNEHASQSLVHQSNHPANHLIHHSNHQLTNNQINHPLNYPTNQPCNQQSSSASSAINSSINQSKLILMNSTNSSLNARNLWNLDSGIQTKMPSSKANSCTSRDDEMDTICSLSQNSNLDEICALTNTTSPMLTMGLADERQSQLNCESEFSNANKLEMMPSGQPMTNHLPMNRCLETNLDSTNLLLNQSASNQPINSQLKSNLSFNPNEDAILEPFSPVTSHLSPATQTSDSSLNRNFSQSLNTSQNLANRNAMMYRPNVHQSIGSSHCMQPAGRQFVSSPANASMNYNPIGLNSNSMSNQMPPNQQVNNGHIVNKMPVYSTKQAHSKIKLEPKKASIDYQQTINTLPEIIKILDDPDQVVVSKMVQMIHCILKDEKHRKVVINSTELVKSLIRLTVRSTEIEILKYAAAIFNDFTMSRSGLQIIYQNNIFPALYKLLNSNDDKIVCYAITTLHILLLRQDGATSAVHKTGGIPTIVRLLSKDNYKDNFLAIVADCLQLTAFNNPDVKQIILQCGGPQELIRILNTYSHEKLLLITIRVIKVLSVCPKNKQVIVHFGGMQALAKNLNHRNLRIVLNSLWALRNLSDAAINQTNMNELLHSLVQLLNSENISIVICSAGILRNLTCNNQFNKMFICQINGLNILLQTLIKAEDREEILEPTLSTLSHLTCRYPNAEQCQNLVRLNCGLEPIIKLLHPPSKWPIIKACINLIRNLALSPANIQVFKDLGVIQRLFQLLSKANQEIKRVCAYSFDNITACDSDGIKMYEIIDGILGALQILAKNQKCCELIINLDLVPICIDIIYYPLENVQKVAVCCLNELAKLPSGMFDL